MSELRYTLVSEGVTDKRLLPVLTWLVQQHSCRSIAATWADLTVPGAVRGSLADRIRSAVELYPCDLLFVHRDADNQPRAHRIAEITAAWGASAVLARVPVVPIRMQETWLLLNESAIRRAAGRPTGREPLGLPRRAVVETHADPKHTLRRALEVASGLSGRHLRRFDASAATYRLAELIEDYSILRGLAGFDALEADLRHALVAGGLDR